MRLQLVFAAVFCASLHRLALRSNATVSFTPNLLQRLARRKRALLLFQKRLQDKQIELCHLGCLLLQRLYCLVFTLQAISLPCLAVITIRAVCCAQSWNSPELVTTTETSQWQRLRPCWRENLTGHSWSETLATPRAMPTSSLSHSRSRTSLGQFGSTMLRVTSVSLCKTLACLSFTPSWI